MHEGIYDNTYYLQIECFKFCFFPSIQKELDDIKDYWNNLSLCGSVRQIGNQDQQIDQIFFILLGTVPVNTFSNTTIRIPF